MIIETKLVFINNKLHQNNHLHGKNSIHPRKNALIFNKIVVQLKTFAVRDEQFSQIFFAASFLSAKQKNQKTLPIKFFYNTQETPHKTIFQKTQIPER